MDVACPFVCCSLEASLSDPHADVVIIGAGPTGAAAAWRLAGAGVSVICLDRGGWFDPAAIPRDAPDYELRRQREWHANPNIRQAEADYPVDDDDTPIKPMVANFIGGSSTFWSAHVPRFRPDDFRMRSRDGIGDDWPIDYDDLAPYYALNEARIGAAYIAGDRTAPVRAPATVPLPTIGPCGRRFAAAFERKGWHWWPVDLVMGADTNAAPCTHPGPCDIGCHARQRSCADRAYVAPATAAGARFLPHTRVLRLEHDVRGRVAAAICATPEGTIRVRGSRFVLAANGMGTPRLLLLSDSGRFAHGLANRSGLVGRNLMLHPYARVHGRFAEPLGTWAPGQTAGIISFQFFRTPPEAGIQRGFRLQLNVAPGPMALALGAIGGRRIAWGAAHHREFEALFDHLAGLSVCAEDLAEPENRIALSDRLRDADGLPAPRMIYRVSDNSRRCLDYGMDRAAELLEEAGAEATLRTPLQAQSGFHIMGTARMGEDPERSVTDAIGRCHDVPNLFVADASVFVTSSSMNPTATAQALALRCADGILACRRDAA